MNTSALWSVLACAGCTVPAIELEGKPCPCLDGYFCDVASNTCVRSDASESCLVAPAGAPLYSTGFDDLTGWTPGGVGSWRAEAGMAIQSDTTSEFAYTFLPAVAANDYRIVSKFRAIGGMGPSTSIELAARVQRDNSGGQYHCNWDPINGQFNIMYTLSATETGFLHTVYIDVSQLPGHDPMGWFTMEFQVRGSRLDCCVRGVGGAAGFANDTRFSAGAPGMKTYLVAAAYDDYTVLAIE